MSIRERLCPVMSANARQRRTIRDLTRLTERQEGRIRVLEREAAETFVAASNAAQEIRNLRRENAALMETCPSTIEEAER